MRSAGQSSRTSPQPSGRRRTGPCMDSDHDRTRVLEVIPNSRWFGACGDPSGGPVCNLVNTDCTVTITQTPARDLPDRVTISFFQMFLIRATEQ